MHAPTDLRWQTSSAAELVEVAEAYFDMLYTHDLGLFDQLFHGTAQLSALDHDSVRALSASQYRDYLATQPSPRSRGAPREDELVSLDFASPTLAMLKLRARADRSIYLDYLSLVRADEGWRIVGKAYQRLRAN